MIAYSENIILSTNSSILWYSFACLNKLLQKNLRSSTLRKGNPQVLTMYSKTRRNIQKFETFGTTCNKEKAYHRKTEGCVLKTKGISQKVSNTTRKDVTENLKTVGFTHNQKGYHRKFEDITENNTVVLYLKTEEMVTRVVSPSFACFVPVHTSNCHVT